VAFRYGTTWRGFGYVAFVIGIVARRMVWWRTPRPWRWKAVVDSSTAHHGLMSYVTIATRSYRAVNLVYCRDVVGDYATAGVSNRIGGRGAGLVNATALIVT
jgi:hypothetical protein